MLVATFGPTTSWAGKTIAYDAGHFTLEGHGEISAADVLKYDRQGQIIWGYDGLKEWVTEQVSSAPQPPGPTASMMGAAVDGAVGQPGRRRAASPRGPSS